MNNLYETPSIQPILLTARGGVSEDSFGDNEDGVDAVLPL